MPQPYPQAAPAFPQMLPQGQMSGYPQYNAMPSVSSSCTLLLCTLGLTLVKYPPQPPLAIPQRYPPTGGPMPGYGPPMQSVPPQQSWPQAQPVYNQSPSPVPAPFSQPSRASQPQSQSGIPYAFGQLPANANPNDPKSQHPIPGSYNRHAFNPKTQSFVPSTGMSPVQQPPMALYNMGGGPQGSPQVGSSHVSYSSYNSPAPPQPFMGPPLSYGMSRQSSNNSLPAYHQQGTSPQHLPQHPGGPHLPQMVNQMPQMVGQMPHHMGHQMQAKNMQGPQQIMNNGNPQPHFSSLPNYGNPATLPQKPPTGI